MANAQQQMSPAQLNALQRQAVLSSSVDMTQAIYSAAVNPATTPVLQIQPRNVGFIKRFTVLFSATVTNTDAGQAASLTDFGLGNFFSNIQFTDLNNNQRINTSGWHMSFLNTVRHRKPFATGLTPLQDATSTGAGTYANQMSKYGNNNLCVQAPATVVSGTPGTIQGYLDIPLTYSDDDLRGGIYANVVNAVMQLQLTFNPQFFCAQAADSTLSVYRGTVADLTLSNINITIYQQYLDQLPFGPSGVVLPNLDISTIYEMKLSQFTNIASGQDFPVQFANFRDFLSTFNVFDEDTTGDSGRALGNVNYFALQAANFTNFWKLDPTTLAQRTREITGFDFPLGVSYDSYRRRPVSTVQYGNVERVINPKNSTTSSLLLVGWEDFALINSLTQAGSLASGG